MRKKYTLTSLSGMPDLRDKLEAAANVCDRNRPLPPTLVVMHHSTELEPVLDDLCVELNKHGLVEFTGNRPWLNIRIEHPDAQGFASFERMLSTLRREAGYRNRFGGVVRVDVTDWLNNTDDERMDALMAFIHDYQDEIMFIVTVSVDEPDKADDLRQAMSRWMYITDVDVNPIPAEKFVDYIEEQLRSAGHILAPQARQLLTDTVQELSFRDDFAGFREVEGLAKAILFSVAPHRQLTAEHLSRFSLDGQWMQHRIGRRSTGIGFEGGQSA